MSKSVSTTLDEKDYDALKALAKSEDRNVSGQARHMLRATLNASRDKPQETLWLHPGKTDTLPDKKNPEVSPPGTAKEPQPG